MVDIVTSEPSVADQLLLEPYRFSFFQAVRLLERLFPERQGVGGRNTTTAEVVRFRTHASLAFPASEIQDLIKQDNPNSAPFLLIANFLGLTGPKGVLPRQYTEWVSNPARGGFNPVQADRISSSSEKHALREFLAIFDHRLLSLFFRAWEKYRYFLAYERGDYARSEPDTFTTSLFSFVGLGVPQLRNQLGVFAKQHEDGHEQALVKLDDLVLLYYGGLLAQRPRSTVNLEGLVKSFFGLPAKVEQFRGQWLVLDRDNQSQMSPDGAMVLGENLVAGERVWDIQNKLRIRIGPLNYRTFLQFIPEPTPSAQNKTFFLLAHLVRMFLGPTLDFDVQLILVKEEIPPCQLSEGPAGPRLGWNTWVNSTTAQHDATDAIFEVSEYSFRF